MTGMEYTGKYCPVTEKMSYASEMGAKMALARIKAYRPNVRAVYQCPHDSCQEWHLTSQEQT